MKKILLGIAIPLLCLLLLVNCAPTADQLPEGMGETHAAYTMAAVLTQAAFKTLEAQLTEVSNVPSSTPTPTLITTAVSTGSSMIVSTSQAVSNLNTACNWAGFVKDVTIPANTPLAPGQRFIKTWRLQNNGSCDWTRDYSLVYAGGTGMEAPNQIALPQTVAPGDMVDLSIEFEAPSTPGTYISYWMLSDAEDSLFGIGNEANGVFWVKIQVVDPSQVNLDLAFNLAENYCSADWLTADGSLPCPGLADTVNGSVYLVYDAVIEGGAQRSSPAIIVIPDSGENGYTQGIFPQFQVSSGDHFSTTIGCLSDYPDCDVIFEIRYRTENGNETLLGSWGQILDAYSHEIDISLDPIAGMSVQFILTVYNNGSPEDDRAFWLFPSIWHDGE